MFGEENENELCSGILGFIQMKISSNHCIVLQIYVCVLS